MVEPDGALSIRRQCELPSVSRSGWYYEPTPVEAEELALLRRIDELHLKSPFYGSRRIGRELRSEGRIVNRKHVQRLMQRMELIALAPRPPSTSESSGKQPRQRRDASVLPDDAGPASKTGRRT